MNTTNAIPYGYCQCGCGGKTAVARQKRTAYGYAKGESVRFIPGHQNLRHGQARSKSSIYRAWASMKSRCQNPDHKNYGGYGARGIKVCRRWQAFEAFFDDMGPKPNGAQIDRIDNDGDYTPSNCRWTSNVVQSRNRRSNRVVTYNGRRMTLAEACESAGLLYRPVWMRLSNGWSVGRALTTPLKANYRRRA